MKFSSICTIASLAALGMAAPALVQREDESASAVSDLANSGELTDAVVNTLAVAPAQAASPAVGPALSPPVAAISGAVNTLEDKSFKKLVSANGVLTSVLGASDSNAADARRIASAKSALSTTYKNLYQDFQDATDAINPSTALVPTNLQQSDISSLTNSVNAVTRTLSRLHQGLVNANHPYLPNSVKQSIQPDTDAIKGTIKGLVDPISNFVSTAIGSQTSNLNLTPLYQASQALLDTVKSLSQGVGLPAGNKVSDIGKSLSLSLNLILGGPKPTTN